MKYVGLNPAFDYSGKNRWEGGVGGHGRKDLRNLLIEAAQSILRSQHPIAKWGRKLLARKGERNLVVAAMARKLTVAIWYLMMGRWTPIEEIDTRLESKVSTLITTMGARVWRDTTRLQLREQLSVMLKSGRTYLVKEANAQPGPAV